MELTTAKDRSKHISIARGHSEPTATHLDEATSALDNESERAVPGVPFPAG